MKVLTEEAVEKYLEFLASLAEQGCTCWKGFPPCPYCTHEGNPINLLENAKAWQQSFSEEELAGEDVCLARVFGDEKFRKELKEMRKRELSLLGYNINDMDRNSLLIVIGMLMKGKKSWE